MDEYSYKSGFRKGIAMGIFSALLICIIIMAALANGLLSGGSGPGELAVREIGKKLTTMQQVVDAYYLFDEDLTSVEDSIYKGMAAGLNDPYTEYYTPEEFTAIMEESEGEYSGIGVQLGRSPSTGAVIVWRVFKGSPAEKAGLKKGDLIEKIDDVEAADDDFALLTRDYIRGDEGSSVEVTVIQDGERKTLSIPCEALEVDTVDFEMLNDRTGYIFVTEFDTVTVEQFKNAVDTLEAQGMERLVIDLRDNPGGSLDAVVEMAAYVLPEDKMDGTIVTTADKNGTGTRYYCKDGEILFEQNDGGGDDPDYPKKDGHQLDIPMAVLLNGWSASASEVFAGAMKDYGQASLIGTTSFGKGIVQSIVTLDDGSAMKITMAHYYTPGGFDLHGKGLEPDIKVELDEKLWEEIEIPKEQDNQLKKAVETLKKQ